jgi:hypothetical protein
LGKSALYVLRSMYVIYETHQPAVSSLCEVLSGLV